MAFFHSGGIFAAVAGSTHRRLENRRYNPDTAVPLQPPVFCHSGFMSTLGAAAR
jgi:hypothetical protein